MQNQPITPKRNIARENIEKRRRETAAQLDRLGFTDAKPPPPPPVLKSLAHASMVRDHEVTYKLTPEILDKINPVLIKVIDVIDKYIHDLETDPTTPRPDIYNIAIEHKYADALELSLVGSGYKVEREYRRTKPIECAVGEIPDSTKTFFAISWV